MNTLYVVLKYDQILRDLFIYLLSVILTYQKKKKPFLNI